MHQLFEGVQRGLAREPVYYENRGISQHNKHLKTAGILSLGAFLKQSEQFLLVWDNTYASRLWCILELAAFLKSHEHQEHKVQIRLAVTWAM